MKIIKDERGKERRKRFNRLVEIARNTLPAYKISEASAYFTMRPQGQMDITGFMISIYPEKNTLLVYDKVLLPDAVEIAKAYEKSEGREFNVHVCYD